jgi:hypothetical protein
MKLIGSVLTAMTFLILTVSMALAQEKKVQTAVDYFKAVRTSVTANLPAQFTGELSGKTIDGKIRNIPQDSLLDKKQRAFVQLAYSKKTGIAVVVRNVDELYQDLYRDLPKQIFAFDLILSSENNDPFLKKYDISYQSQTPELIILRLGIRSAENSLLLYIRPDSRLIQRIDYSLGKQLLSSTIIAYGDWTNSGKRYVIPSKFITKTLDAEGRNRPEILELGDIRFKTSVKK